MKKLLLVGVLVLGCGGRIEPVTPPTPQEYGYGGTKYTQLIASTFNGIHSGEDLIIAKLPAKNICVDVFNGTPDILQAESWHVIPVTISIPNNTGSRQCLEFSGGILKVMATETIQGTITVQVSEPK